MTGPAQDTNDEGHLHRSTPTPKYTEPMDDLPVPAHATLEIVAQAAGVSRATVSRVVNGSPKVSRDIAASVSEAITRLNYVPNRAARSLASRTTGSIALIVPEDVTRFFGDPFFASIVQGITQRLDETDYVLNLLVASSDPGHKTTRYLRSGSIDGALVISHHIGDDLLSGCKVPLVFGGRPIALEDVDDICFVDVDNVTGAQIGTRRLVETGRGRIGSIAGPLDMPAGIDRLEGFRRAMTEAGLTADAVEFGDFSVTGAMEATGKLLDRVPDLDGLFVASDLMATGAIAVLRERGIRIPEDVAIVGFDDSPAATSTDVKLTTVSQPSTEMGCAMADTLLRLLAHDPAVTKHNIMQTRLVVRESA